MIFINHKIKFMANAKFQFKTSKGHQSASLVLAGQGAFGRNSWEWTDRQDMIVLERIFEDRDITVYELSAEFAKDPVLIIERIIDSEIPSMAGIEIDQDSQEKAELMGLTLSGVPIKLALRWCAATWEQVDRPLWTEVEKSMTRCDLRPAMNLVRETGMWFTSVSQIEALEWLLDCDFDHVLEGVQGVLARVDAPTPDVVFQQLLGAFEDEALPIWR